MNLYYAFGGGLGHLCRSQAVIHTLGMSAADFVILTNSGFAGLIFRNSVIVQISDDYYNNKEALLEKICLIIKEFEITSIYIDAFPCGIIGELNDFQLYNCELIYIARILNWENYSPLIKKLHLKYSKTYIVEELPAVQLDFINRNSKFNEFLNLVFPSNNGSGKIQNILGQFESPPWLIVHTGSFEELQLLFSYASDIAEIEQCDPEYLIISQTIETVIGNKIKQINYFPASDFFHSAPKIFTACGFNSMLQTIPFSSKHHFIPFKRKFDNQFLRSQFRKQI